MHIGIIPDGNRRWAKENNKTPDELLSKWKEMISSRMKGDVVSFAVAEKEGEKHPEKWKYAKDINEISLYVMSKDNFGRQDYTLDIIYRFVEYVADMNAYFDFNINIYGNIDLLPENVRQNVDKILSKTNKESIYNLHLAVLYDPEEDIKEYASGKRRNQSPIDLVVRSGREQRSSGFFPCHTLYSEWYYSDKLWPEITQQDVDDAMKQYESRNRRFGK